MRNGAEVFDSRSIKGEHLRKTSVLPLRSWLIDGDFRQSSDGEELYYYEAQVSSLSMGVSEWFWTEYFLVDTYFGSEPGLATYFAGEAGCGFDPPLGGHGNMSIACFDPREYWLKKIARRMYQVRSEFAALIETFNKRMDQYFYDMRARFVDDAFGSHMQHLSLIIETTEIFINSIGQISDNWMNFRRTDLALFTKYAVGKPMEWSNIIDNISHNVTELERLQKLLVAQQKRFNFKLSSFVAFPLLFTTALFGMDFLKPTQPWPVFFAVLLVSSALNYAIAAKGPQKIFVALKDRITTAIRARG
ncbi:hypothetical protein BS50DRAFT_482272 [Corynespora cassiicola Philippines]|uniref:Uncharacterized protein n=1 Tax=Corynespora cassiicola Philippines TaxID=1448308 RepID=A0A2T2P6K4_CORCC|nr:hypothetical protein BS50DRAFT_482272 [Corynespora cassiicola Philippines]